MGLAWRSRFARRLAGGVRRQIARETMPRDVYPPEKASTAIWQACCQRWLRRTPPRLARGGLGGFPGLGGMVASYLVDSPAAAGFLCGAGLGARLCPRDRPPALARPMEPVAAAGGVVRPLVQPGGVVGAASPARRPGTGRRRMGAAAPAGRAARWPTAKRFSRRWPTVRYASLFSPAWSASARTARR